MINPPRQILRMDGFFVAGFQIRDARDNAAGGFFIAIEAAPVADAIGEHYLPLAGAYPKTLIGSALAVLDKFDTLMGYFGLGITQQHLFEHHGVFEQIAF